MGRSTPLNQAYNVTVAHRAVRSAHVPALRNEENLVPHHHPDAVMQRCCVRVVLEDE